MDDAERLKRVIKQNRRLKRILGQCWDAAGLLCARMTGKPHQAWSDSDDLVDQIEELAELADNAREAEDRADALAARVRELEGVLAKQEHEIQQTLGRVLAYPWYADDPESFPEATEADGVCTGEHTAVTIAAEAGDLVNRLRAELYASMDAEKRLRGVLGAAETAIRDCIRRPMGVEPDSATEALRLIAALAPAPAAGKGVNGG